MSVNENLRNALSSINPKDGPVFAVLDGAHFENLPQQLLLGEFVHRPLYLDRGDNDPQRVITSPHLVWIDEREVTPMGRRPAQVIIELLRVVGTGAGAVFWQCPDGGDALYRHLRGINMVMIPHDAAGESDAPENEELANSDEFELSEPDQIQVSEDEQSDETHTMVLFRHADANVIAQLLPCMSPDEAARFMGPASLVFAAPEPEWSDGNPITYLRAVPGAPSYRGPLRLSEATLAGIEDTQLKASRGTIASYLRDVAPEYTELHSPSQLHALILDAERTGDELGFQSEHAQGLWALLALITGGEITSNPQVLGHFASDPRDPEEVLNELYEQMIDASDEDLEDLA